MNAPPAQACKKRRACLPPVTRRTTEGARTAYRPGARRLALTPISQLAQDANLVQEPVVEVGHIALAAALADVVSPRLSECRTERDTDSALVVCPAAWPSKISLLERRGYRTAKLWMLKR